MFDTVTLKVQPIKIDRDLLLKYQEKPTTYFDHDTGELKSIFIIHDKYIPYIEYREYIQSLEIQISIPKFLYGNNVILTKESDIPLFFQRLQARLHALFNINMRTEDWYLSRIDVCWNFQVGNQVRDYIRQLGIIQLPRTKPHINGYLETVTHKNGSKRITFYNKEKECIDHKEPPHIIEQAKGFLRMEISPSYSDMKKYSSKRIAIELLTKPFFEHATKRVLKQIKLPDSMEGLTIDWLHSHAHIVGQIERTLGFQALHTYFSEVELKQIYAPSTYAYRKNQAKKLEFPSQAKLMPLYIDYSEIG